MSNKENKVTYGLSNVYIAPIKDEGGVIGYDTPIKVPGAVTLTMNPTGDSTEYYADNIVYYAESSKTGYEGDLEMALLPEEIKIRILGNKKDANGAIIESTEDKGTEFALMFEVDGDQRKRRNTFYRCTMSVGAEEHKTKEEKTEITGSKLALKALPRISDNIIKSSMEENEQNTEKYNAYFTKVYEPELKNI